MSDVKRWAVVPAAGRGRRMGAEIPKQYLSLAGRSVIDHTLERLLLHPAVHGVVVVLDANDSWWAQTEFAGHPGLVQVTGGAERADSVLNGLTALEGRANPSDWVLVHDAARPCVRRSDIDHLVESLDGHPVGGLLGIPLHDTLKRADADGRIETTVDRSGLWRAFTPQMFRLQALADALRGALAAGATVTDEASAMEWAGERPLMVSGHADNIKITEPRDLELAHFFLERQEGL